MQLNLAEKISIVLSATTLTFVFGLAACSPLAPSVEKNRLSIRGTHQGGGTSAPEERPEPTPNGTHLTFTRSAAGANLILGKDASEWYFKKHSGHSKEFLSSPAANPDTLEQFKQIGRVDIPTTPSSDWLVAADGAPGAKVVFHLNLTDSSLTPAQLENFEYDLVPPTPAEIRSALEAGASVDWGLRIRTRVDRETRTAFLSALEQIRLIVPLKPPTEDR